MQQFGRHQCIEPGRGLHVLLKSGRAFEDKQCSKPAVYEHLAPSRNLVRDKRTRMGDCPCSGSCQEVASPPQLFQDTTEFGLKHDRYSDQYRRQTVLNQPVQDRQVQCRPHNSSGKKDDQHAADELVRLRPANQDEESEEDEGHDRDVKDRQWRHLAE